MLQGILNRSNIIHVKEIRWKAANVTVHVHYRRKCYFWHQLLVFEMYMGKRQKQWVCYHVLCPAKVAPGKDPMPIQYCRSVGVSARVECPTSVGHCQVQAVESGYWPLYRYNPDKARSCHYSPYGWATLTSCCVLHVLLHLLVLLGLLFVLEVPVTTTTTATTLTGVSTNLSCYCCWEYDYCDGCCCYTATATIFLQTWQPLLYATQYF